MIGWAKAKTIAEIETGNNIERHRETSLFSSPQVNRHNYGTYMKDGVRKIDYVIAYKEEETENEQTLEYIGQRKYYENNLKTEGLELETDVVEQHGEKLVFVKIHVPWPTLCHHAEELNIRAPLWIHDKPILRRESIANQNILHKFCCIAGNDGMEQQNEKKTRLYGKNTVINWPFKRKHMERYAIRDPNTFFTDTQRIEIVYEIMQKAPCNPKEPKQRGIEALLESVYETAYPLHDGDIDDIKASDATDYKFGRLKLKQSWATWKHTFHSQPLHEVRNYFGEKIAFYYAFMDTYTRMLLFPSVVGLLMFLVGLIATVYNPEIKNICTVSHHSASHENVSHSAHQGESYATAMHGSAHDIELPTESIALVENVNLEHHETNRSETKEFIDDLDSLDMSSKWMCPICRPPNCEVWEMVPEGCFYYSWSFRFDNYISFVLSSFTTLWAIIFLKMWKRREASLAVAWGSYDAEEQNVVIRPEYAERAPAERKNPVTLEPEPYVPMNKKIQWMTVSILATMMFLLFACVCVIALVVCRIQLYGLLKFVGSGNVDAGKWLVHGLLFVVVTLLEMVYNKFAIKLTNYECPKTEQQFMNSLLTKIFVFAMLNDIIPIGYAAWLKGKTAKTPKDMGALDELCDGGCMGEVTELVAVLLLARLVIGNITEIGIPLLKKSCKRVKTDNKENTTAENSMTPMYMKDFHLQGVEFDGVFEDYMEMMIQFAFITLFIPALPVAPFVCFLNNIAEIRVDATKMVKANRRPLPIRVSGIGIWNKFLDILNKMGVICNAALLAFTSDNVPRLYYRYIYNPGNGDVGYMKFILSKIPISYFGPDGEDIAKKGITECYYQDFRRPYAPFELQPHYWEMMAMRLTVFATYCLFFFVLMWFINTFVSDTPESATTKFKRQHYIVTKTIEAEAAIKEKKLAKDSIVAFKIKQ